MSVSAKGTWIKHWARAHTVCRVIKLALEGHPHLGVGESKAGAGLVRWVGWAGANHRLWWRSSINRPNETRSSTLVAGSVLRFDGERVVALTQTGVTLRAGAGTKSAAIQRAEKDYAALRICEAEARARLVRRVGWHRDNGWHRWRRSVYCLGEGSCDALIAG